MDVRRLTRTFAGGALSRAMADLNARHPWSHNDHFHSWIEANLPARRHRALDVGCGQGALIAKLATVFDEVLGADLDESMREASRSRCAGLPHVRVTAEALGDLDGPFDLVTMVAVLHHLDVPTALSDVRRILAPGGRFLAVGLAPPHGPRDLLWDMASIVTNPLIGYVKHPWPNRLGHQLAPFPVKDPTLSFDEVRALAKDAMPGVVMRHQLGFRHTISWVKPEL